MESVGVIHLRARLFVKVELLSPPPDVALEYFRQITKGETPYLLAGWGDTPPALCICLIMA